MDEYERMKCHKEIMLNKQNQHVAISAVRKWASEQGYIVHGDLEQIMEQITGQARKAQQKVGDKRISNLRKALDDIYVLIDQDRHVSAMKRAADAVEADRLEGDSIFLTQESPPAANGFGTSPSEGMEPNGNTGSPARQAVTTDPPIPDKL
jgi:hypothetical protein